MREIKFRGRQIDNGKWVYGDYFKTPLTSEVMNTEPKDGWSFLCGKERYCISQNNCVFEVYPETIGQYTGLKDMKRTDEYPEGQDIYEGDILDCSYLNPLTQKIVKRYFQVVFENGCFYAKCIGHSPYGDTLLCFKNYQGEVIGNIYQNQELLEVNKWII